MAFEGNTGEHARGEVRGNVFIQFYCSVCEALGWGQKMTTTCMIGVDFLLMFIMGSTLSKQFALPISCNNPKTLLHCYLFPFGGRGDKKRQRR